MALLIESGERLRWEFRQQLPESKKSRNFLLSGGTRTSCLITDLIHAASSVIPQRRHRNGSQARANRDCLD
jgi:hypothetical protein